MTAIYIGGSTQHLSYGLTGEATKVCQYWVFNPHGWPSNTCFIVPCSDLYLPPFGTKGEG